MKTCRVVLLFLLTLTITSTMTIASTMASAEIPAAALTKLYQLSVSYEESGNLKEAASMMQQILDSGPSYEACLRMGWLQRQLGDYKKARSSYQCAMDQAPGSFDARLGMLYTLNALKELDAADTLAKELHKEAPWNVWLRRAMAWLSYMKGDYSEAAGHYAKVLEGDDADLEIQAGYGLSLVMDGQVDKGKTICQKVLEEAPENSAAKLCMARTSWRFTFVADLAKAFYPDPADGAKSAMTGGDVALNMRHPGGLGLHLDGTYGSFSFSGSSYVYRQFTGGAGLSLIKPSYSLWGHAAIITGSGSSSSSDSEAKRDGTVLSIFGAWTGTPVQLGAAVDLGLYDSLTSTQLSLMLSLKVSNLTLTVLPMAQLHYEDASDDTTSSSTTSETTSTKFYSVEARATVELNPVTITLGGWYGERWFTSQAGGLLIWNSDELLTYGARINVALTLSDSFTPFITFRWNKATEQHGVEQDQQIISAALGMSYSF